jgi:hypothetical protein
VLCINSFSVFVILHSYWSPLLPFVITPLCPCYSPSLLPLNLPPSLPHYPLTNYPTLSPHNPTHSASHAQRWGAQTQSASLLGGGGSASKTQGLFSTFSIFLWRIGTPFIMSANPSYSSIRQYNASNFSPITYWNISLHIFSFPCFLDLPFLVLFKITILYCFLSW